MCIRDRYMGDKRMHTFDGHNDEVMKVEFSPFNKSIFASASSDRRLIIWDINKVGEEIREEDARDGAAEMLFVHSGHRAKIPDFNWNSHERFLCASVEEESNILQIWQMAEAVYQDCLLYTSPSPRDRQKSRMPSSA
eukprot:TRINITY_DN11412_c0_g1_i2.p2 TRINITY_DN11412_c0_g1~~TRINITY_DN11412_c0_g1_i2.p2  ORF type:complete len:137 (-),score=42.79 TRINITY_DN11412_c0_g1_i2:11-421(-)